MDKVIFDILSKLEEKHFEGYIVGGYVRDFLMNRKSYDVDICTNATVKDLSEILSGNVNASLYGAFKISKPPYNIDITTYRIDVSYLNRHPTVLYTNSVSQDVLRRDFTVNTILMDKNGNIVDYLGGLKDLREKKIRCVGNPQEKLLEDPLRILRALRFQAVLNFTIEKDTLTYINKYKDNLKELPLTRVKQELDKILMCDNVIKSLDYLRKLGILKILGISYKKIRKTKDLCGMYAQLEVPKDYPFTKKEKNNIKNIQKILKYGKIDNTVVYYHGLYYAMVAGEILGYERLNIAMLEKNLPIHKRKDINITPEEICSLGIEKNKLNKIYEDLEYMLLMKKLPNRKEELEAYILKFKKGTC